MTSLRTLRPEDVRACAALHRRAFPSFFLSELGEPFLREFYRGFVGGEDAVSVVAADPSGRIIGVVVGTTEPRGFFKRLLARRWWAFALASASFAVRKPRHIPRLLRAVLYRGEIPVAVDGALLSSICVDPNAAPGTGRALLEAFTARGHINAIDAAFLTTDARDNDRVNRFYQLSGWGLAGSYSTAEGRLMNVYQWRSASGELNEG